MDFSESLRQALSYGRDIAQGASNAVAGNVSGPVDAISWALRKGGLGNVIGPAPVGGSDWMAQRGLTAQPVNALAGGIGEFAGMAGPMTAMAKAPQIANGFLRVQQNAAAPVNALAGQRGAIVYHGSPHSFDAFDMSKIGTGEGAQAYGHGLYLADAPSTAASYKLAGVEDNFGSTAEKATDAIWNVLDRFPHGGVEKAPFGPNRSLITRDELLKKVQTSASDVFDQLGPGLQKKAQEYGRPQVNIYKEDLPDEHIAKMLDWDKPLSQQSAEVQKAVTPVLDRMRSDAMRPAAGWGDLQGQAPTTDAMFQQLLKGDSAMSKELRARGIPGIKYLDGGSRGAGTGTRNYVVFDDALPKIIERNGLK